MSVIKKLQTLIRLFGDLNMIDVQNGNVVRDVYEYLIGQFLMKTGKKAGGIVNAHQVCEVISQIVAIKKDIVSVYKILAEMIQN